MRTEVLLYLVLRLVVGSSMLVQAIWNVVQYEAYTAKIHVLSMQYAFFNTEFFNISAPLFPFLEFFLGAFVLVSLYYKKVLIVALTLFGVASVFYGHANLTFGTGVMFGLIICLSYLLLKSQHNQSIRAMQKTGTMDIY
jgi:hypothetical protein